MYWSSHVRTKINVSRVPLTPSACWWQNIIPIRGVYHADGLAGSHVVIVGVPSLEFWVLSVLQDVLLALEVGMVVADPGSALHTDGVHPGQTQWQREANFTCSSGNANSKLHLLSP